MRPVASAPSPVSCKDVSSCHPGEGDWGVWGEAPPQGTQSSKNQESSGHQGRHPLYFLIWSGAPEVKGTLYEHMDRS